jgi:hypothetical protein
MFCQGTTSRRARLAKAYGRNVSFVDIGGFVCDFSRRCFVLQAHAIRQVEAKPQASPGRHDPIP